MRSLVEGWLTEAVDTITTATEERDLRIRQLAGEEFKVRRRTLAKLAGLSESEIVAITRG